MQVTGRDPDPTEEPLLEGEEGAEQRHRRTSGRTVEYTHLRLGHRPPGRDDVGDAVTRQIAAGEMDPTEEAALKGKEGAQGCREGCPRGTVENTHLRAFPQAGAGDDVVGAVAVEITAGHPHLTARVLSQGGERTEERLGCLPVEHPHLRLTPYAAAHDHPRGRGRLHRPFARDREQGERNEGKDDDAQEGFDGGVARCVGVLPASAVGLIMAAPPRSSSEDVSVQGNKTMLQDPRDSPAGVIGQRPSSNI